MATTGAAHGARNLTRKISPPPSAASVCPTLRPPPLISARRKPCWCHSPTAEPGFSPAMPADAEMVDSDEGAVAMETGNVTESGVSAAARADNDLAADPHASNDEQLVRVVSEKTGGGGDSQGVKRLKAELEWLKGALSAASASAAAAAIPDASPSAIPAVFAAASAAAAYASASYTSASGCSDRGIHRRRRLDAAGAA